MRAVYEIQVEGELDQSWEQWLDGLTIGAEPTGRQPLHAAKPAELRGDQESAIRTTLSGAVADQAALRGLLCRLWDLNLTIVSVQRIERGEQGG
jgi:hypothetical protein